MKTQRIPLVGSLISRVLSGTVAFDYDQQFLNCFPQIQKNPITGDANVKLLKRAGKTSIATVGTANDVAVNGPSTYWSGQQLYAFPTRNLASTTLKVWDQTGAQIGGDIVAGGTSVISVTETKISDVPTLVLLTYLTSRVYGWFYTYGGAWTQITDADFPPNQATPLGIVGQAAQKDGYMFVQTENGYIWNSDINSVANWTATSFIDAGDSPDRGGGVATYGNLLVAFGTKTVQFFQNSGNAVGSPLTRVPNTINIGLDGAGFMYSAGYRNYINVGDTVYFIGINPSDTTRHIYRLKGMGAEQVSNAYVDGYLNASNFSNVNTTYFAGVYFDRGMSHLMLRIASKTLVFCVDTGIWWVSSLAVAEVVGPYGLNTRTIYGASTEYQDFTVDYEMMVRTERLDQGTTKKKSYSEAELICDSQSTSGNILISWSDDDYATFSTARTIDSSTGQKRITRLGATQRRYNNKRAWKISETVNRPFRGEALVLTYEEGNT